MLARLGFAVAVHTSPDVLLVDEVLAVGDMGFSIKCYRKIAEFRNQGGSIVLVSHSPYTIRTNCDRVVWIEHGSVQAIGDAEEICDEYELAVAQETGPAEAERREYGDGTVRVVAFDYPASIVTGEGLSVTIELEATRPIVDPIVAIGLAAVNGQTITANDSRTDQVKLIIREGAQTIKVTYPVLSLRAGIYTFSMMVAERIMTNSLVTVPNCGRPEVTSDARDHGAGILSVKPDWCVP
jgi:ABC-type multidrug transport system ATPase subunit